MRLSLQQILTPNIVETIPDISNISGPCILELSDGEVELPVRHAIVHLIYWQNLHAFNIPVCKRHVVFTTGCCSDEIISKFQSMAYREIVELYPDKKNEALLRLFKTVNHDNLFIINHLQEWVGSMDIFGMLDIMDEPAIQEIINVEIDSDTSTDVAEKILFDANMKLYAALSNKATSKNNILLPYIQSNMINRDQLAQVFISLGVRTDIDDMVITYPIATSYLRGLRDIKDYLIDSLASKKSHFYNSVAVRDSQYFSRKQHLLTSSIIKIYPGNCGTEVTAKFEVTPENYRNILGKNIRTEDGSEIRLAKENIHPYIGTIIDMYSPGTCKYTDGYCEHCGGEMSKYLPPELNVGILSATIVVKDITQLILSSKHFSKTNSIVYKIPDEGNAYFIRRNNELYWRREFKTAMSGMKVGFLLRDMCHVNDLTLLDQDDVSISEEKFSKPSFMIIRKEGVPDVEIPLVSGGAVPFLAAETLFYMKDNINDLEMDETMIWIPMDTFSTQLPLFRSVVSNNSMMAYMKKAAAFLQTDIGRYTSYNAALKDFTDIIYSKVHVNIIHIETMLKAYLVTSQLNYDIPVVNDPENVMFQINPRIIKNRTVSGELAFQCFMQYISHPGTFCVPRSAGVFDSFFSLN